MMKTTKHAEKRLQQRGRSDFDALIIKRYGERSKGGLYLLSRRRARRVKARLGRWLAKRRHSAPFSRRVAAVRRILQSLERLVNWMAVVSNDSTLVTLYPADKRRQRKFMRGQCRPLSSHHNHQEV